MGSLRSLRHHSRPIPLAATSSRSIVFRGLARKPDQGVAVEWRRIHAGCDRAPAICNLIGGANLNEADSEACLRHVIGCKPIGLQGANLIFQVISAAGMSADR